MTYAKQLKISYPKLYLNILPFLRLLKECSLANLVFPR